MPLVTAFHRRKPRVGDLRGNTGRFSVKPPLGSEILSVIILLAQAACGRLAGQYLLNVRKSYSCSSAMVCSRFQIEGSEDGRPRPSSNWFHLPVPSCGRAGFLLPTYRFGGAA